MSHNLWHIIYESWKGQYILTHCEVPTQCELQQKHKKQRYWISFCLSTSTCRRSRRDVSCLFYSRDYRITWYLMQSNYHIDHMINLVYEIENFIIRINDRPICEFKNPPVERHKLVWLTSLMTTSKKRSFHIIRVWFITPLHTSKIKIPNKYQGTSGIQAFEEKLIA